MRWLPWIVVFIAACGTTAPHDAQAEPAPVSAPASRGLVPTRLATAHGEQLTMDQQYLYWLEKDGVYRLSKSGGTKEKIVDGEVLQLLVDEVAIRWLQKTAYNTTRRSHDYELRQLLRGKVNVETLVTFSKPPRVLAQGEQAIYYSHDQWTDKDGLRRYVLRYDNSNGKQDELYEIPRERFGPPDPQQLIVGRERVFLTTSSSGVTCVNKSTGIATECVAGAHTTGLVLGDGSLYWWDALFSTPGIYKDTLQLAHGPKLHSAIAIDSPNRYSAARIPPGHGFDEFSLSVGGPLAYGPRGLVAAVNQSRARRPGMVCGSCITEYKALPKGRLLWLRHHSRKPVLLAKQTSVTSLVAASERVYWIDGLSGVLHSVEYPKDG